MTFLITKCRTPWRPATVLTDQRRFSAVIQSLGDFSLAADADVDDLDKQAKASTDMAIFEPFSSEYIDQGHAVLQHPPLASSNTRRSTHPRWVKSHRFFSDAGLARLVVNGDFARAENLRQELFDSNVQITRDVVFADAAVHAWQTKPALERTEAFHAWFSLFPSAVVGNIRRCRKILFDVKRRLFTDPTDLNSLACFALVASRKGFGNFVCVDIFTHIARFASPAVSSAFLDACEKAALAFYARFKGDTKENSTFSIWEAENHHNAYVRSLCLAGHLDAAVERLSYILEKGISITAFTWVVFLETLSHVGREDLLHIVRKQRSTSTRAESDLNYQKPTSPSLSATDLSQMMANYVDSGNAEVLDQYREELLKSGVTYDLWAAAQMKYYHNIKQHTVVLRQFIRYYTCVGIRKELVHRYIETDSPWYQLSSDQEHPSLPVIRPLPSMRGRNRWPSTHAIAIAWQSVVAFANDLQSLELLYREFLDYWDLYRPSTVMEDWQVSPKGFPSHIRFQYPPIMKPDAVHFHVFVSAFSRLGDAKAVMRVMNDMHIRDIRPDAHTWTVLTGNYAGADFDSVEKILSRMESTLPNNAIPAVSTVPKDATRMRTGPLPRPANWIPGPTLVTYTTILRGLVDQGKLKEARRFEVRMKEAGYVDGSDGHTENVLELLRVRESTARVPWHQRASWRPRKK